jgi:hypothetical protein
MWVRTTITVKRWTEERSGRKIERTERTGKGRGRRMGAWLGVALEVCLTWLPPDPGSALEH